MLNRPVCVTSPIYSFLSHKFNSHPLSCQHLISELSISHGRADLSSVGSLALGVLSLLGGTHHQPAMDSLRSLPSGNSHGVAS